MSNTGFARREVLNPPNTAQWSSCLHIDLEHACSGGHVPLKSAWLKDRLISRPVPLHGPLAIDEDIVLLDSLDRKQVTVDSDGLVVVLDRRVCCFGRSRRRESGSWII
jgi:hypothetical protein